MKCYQQIYSIGLWCVCVFVCMREIETETEIPVAYMIYEHLNLNMLIICYENI